MSADFMLQKMKNVTRPIHHFGIGPVDDTEISIKFMWLASPQAVRLWNTW